MRHSLLYLALACLLLYSITRARELARRWTMMLKLRLPLEWITCLALFLGMGCTDKDDTTFYRNAVTGAPCDPDPATFRKRAHDGGRGGARSPTGIPGDNMDDPHSGKVDCLGDGNSGQGDDKKHPCPPPGCDDQDCCEPPPVEPPTPEPPVETPPDAAPEPPVLE
jgi:hypothetical protein